LCGHYDACKLLVQSNADLDAADMKYRAALSIDVIFIPKTSSFCSFFAVKSLHSFARQRRVIFAFVNSSLSPAPTSKLEAGMIVKAVANNAIAVVV
jgi:hypothetical protein